MANRYGKIGMNQLSETLQSLIKNASGAGIAMKRGSLTITEDTPKVQINLDLFNKHSDGLFVFKNSVFLNEGFDYTVNSDNTISPVNGTNSWEASVDMPVTFDFMSLINVPSDKVQINSQLLAPGSIAEDKLDQALKDKINADKGVKPQEVINIINEAIKNNTVDALDEADVKALLDALKAVDIDIEDTNGNFNSTNVEDALNELFMKAGSVPQDLQSQLDTIVKNIEKLKAKQLEILIKLQLENIIVDTEAGMWFDPLHNAGQIHTMKNTRVADNKLLLVDSGLEGTAEWNNITIGFLADKLRYIHEVSNNNVIAKINSKTTNNQLEISNVSYEFF